MVSTHVRCQALSQTPLQEIFIFKKKRPSFFWSVLGLKKFLQTLSVSPVKEVFIEDGVVVGESFRQPGEPGGRDLLQSGLTRREK